MQPPSILDVDHSDCIRWTLGYSASPQHCPAVWAGQALKPLPPALWLPAADQVPLMEDLEQIFLRSWRESHLTEIRQYQQAPPQPFPPVPGAVAPVTSAQLPWLAGLAASSCNDSVHIIECTYSLAEGLSEMFRLLIEGKLTKTNYVVIICACRSAAIDSCIAVTGEAGPSTEMLLVTPRSPPTPTWLLAPRGPGVCISAG